MAHETRDLATAQHEAAHVVVGAAVGLRLRRVVIGHVTEGRDVSTGYVWFLPTYETPDRPPIPRRREASALMLAAGPAWDLVMGNPRWWSDYDRRELRVLVPSVHGRRAMITAATALLAGLRREHHRVTRALLARDITGADLAALCRGEALED